jgi:hypothetical protein
MRLEVGYWGLVGMGIQVSSPKPHAFKIDTHFVPGLCGVGADGCKGLGYLERRLLWKPAKCVCGS